MRKTPAGNQAQPRAEAPPRVPQPDPAAVRPGSSARQIALERLGATPLLTFSAAPDDEV